MESSFRQMCGRRTVSTIIHKMLQNRHAVYGSIMPITAGAIPTDGAICLPMGQHSVALSLYRNGNLPGNLPGSLGPVGYIQDGAIVPIDSLHPHHHWIDASPLSLT